MLWKKFDNFCFLTINTYWYNNFEKKMSSLQIRVCGRYRLEEKIYEGRRASVYVGKNVQSDVDCAIKCESKSNLLSFVLNQGKTLEVLQGGMGIPHLMWYGENGDFRFLVTELLGNSLEDYLQICGGKFSLKTTLMIADKLLTIIEFVHYKNYLHRDIKPANFVVGMGKKLHQIYAIDFAYATRYVDINTRQHRPDNIAENKFVGTLKFASLNVHRGHRNSRRDDLESIGLMLIYFMKGLPWAHKGGQTLKSARKNIFKIYEETSIEELCSGLPKEFQDYMHYCRKLKYEDIPDYSHLKRIFKERFIKQGYQYDYIYDWILLPLKLKDTQISNRVPLNRFVKLEEESLTMKNCDYDDFQIDFQYSKQEEVQKQEPKPKQEKKPQDHEPRKRASSNIQQRKQTKQKGKSSKDDCQIF